MTSSRQPDQERTLLEAVAHAAERLLGPSEQPRLLEIIAALGRAAGVSRISLVAAEDGSHHEAPRMEVRHQWTAAAIPRPQPANTGWPRYPRRWHEELGRGTTIAGPSRAFPPPERAIVEATGCHAIMLVPVSVGERWYGHLEIGDVAADRTWTSHELEAFRAAAGIVGSGIAHRQALASLERRTAILGAVGEATSLLLEATNWRAALPRVLDSLRSATRTRGAWAYGPDGGRPGKRATLLYEVLAPGTRPAVGHARTLDLSPEAASLLAQGHPIHDRLPASDRHPMRDALMLRGVASWIMVPLDLGDGAMGLVGLDSELPRPWTDGEVEGLSVLAGALRAAIRRGGMLVSVPVVANPWGAPAFPPAVGPAAMPAAMTAPVVPATAPDGRPAEAAPQPEAPVRGDGSGNRD